MHRRFFAILGLLVGLLVGPFALTPAAGAAPKSAAKAAAKHRVVFQVNEDDSRKWNTILANINNVQEELGRVEITVVAIGPGLGMLKADALTANGVQDAMAAGVRFVACGNTMKSLHLTKDDMIDGIAYARAGYVEIMRLQKLGHAYLRP
ncbi:DsrE family protein [Sulfuritalea sp.]|uniref:DsrE family protein n=1 Tax=Sulfuritalea sp. TaxID=2480090 RepID=UPI00286E8FF6|nr:DsrE family protein [Sulfuritalea sp.]